jgi:hypothetical protein
MWSYSGDPEASTRDKTRFLIQDTDSTDQQLSDEEVDSLLTDATDDPYTAAIQGTEILSAKYTRRADKSVGDLSISYGRVAENYRKLGQQIERRAATAAASVGPYAGGIYISDKQIDEDNADLVKPAFKRGMHDYDGPQTEDVNEYD